MQKETDACVPRKGIFHLTWINYDYLPSAIRLLAPAPHGRERPVNETIGRPGERFFEKEKASNVYSIIRVIWLTTVKTYE